MAVLRVWSSGRMGCAVCATACRVKSRSADRWNFITRQIVAYFRSCADRVAETGYNLAMVGAIEIGSLIDRDPAIRARRPKIAGTGVTVMRVAAWYKMGLTPEEIVTQYGHLSLAQVHAALAYYHANPEEVEADLAQEQRFAERVERESQP